MDQFYYSSERWVVFNVETYFIFRFFKFYLSRCSTQVKLLPASTINQFLPL
ncbi:hypothetical protein TTHERM_000558209 (macronuclear) [Tetrahymena thermophila SB210]|uniref:Uncharacterized protein n=1 Tax=Tetrahymena thermophila (strain SB210) TaxID=312017 RepID=W7XFF8_TETTS|nr:hypothetical protein TTHERM_000558209 [Tetrahymena thermophila SB210]EWS72746.1 hypothetical protein TTHERM_000558209 [Tetrahymena thermophila SB210]|eukprot:XP_012654724.1 hypothetical protein TTHERM_000558209 [Tetrahymena thermophila SB210]